jgi:tetratricopeptide (TPR) repeat protein
MNNLLKLILLLIPFHSIAQTKQDSINSRIQILTEKNNNKTISIEEKQDLLNYGYQIQNKGMYLEFYKFDYVGALPHIEKAIDFWVSIKDTMNEANLRKYRGMMLGYLDRFEEGKKEINLAYDLFGKSTSDKQYQIVCLYTLSLLYERENRLDSALHYEKIVNDFYLSKNNEGRLFTSNTHLINLYRKMNEFTEAERYQSKNETVYLDDYDWQYLINFFYASQKLYSEIGQNEKAEKYQKLYEELRDKEYKASNGKLNIKSIFEI